MAQKLIPGDDIFTSFSDGQGAGASNYFNYSQDMDTSFSSITTTVNQLVDEVNGVQGPNQVLPIDILTLNDPLGAGITSNILIGSQSYFPTFISITQLDIALGYALVLNQRAVGQAVSLSPVLGTDDGGTLFAYVALDVNGAVSINTLPGQKTYDVWRIEVNVAGTEFVDNIEKVPGWEYGIDGDDWQRLGDSSTIGGDTFPPTDQAFIRLDRLERLVSGFTTDLQVPPATIGPTVIPGGVAATPGLVVGDGTGTNDLGTGVHRPGLNRWAWSTAGVKRAELDAVGNLDLDTNARVKGNRTATQSIANNTLTLVDFDAADDYDQGNGVDTWHDHTSGTLSDREEFTVPAGCDGLYAIVLEIEMAAGVNAHDVTIQVTVGGTEVASAQIEGGNQRVRFVAAGYVTLTAGLVVRAQVLQLDTVAALAIDLTRARLSIVKVA